MQDFSLKRLSEVHAQTIGFDCRGCYRQTAVQWMYLERRFKGDPTLGDIALQLAKSTNGDLCRSPDTCQAADAVRRRTATPRCFAHCAATSEGH